VFNALLTSPAHHPSRIIGTDMNFMRRALAAALVATALLALSGCGYSMSEFAQKPVGSTAASAEPGALPVKPATYVVDSPATPTASGAPASAGGFPNLNQVPTDQKAKLLTPEEKAKVIADLEALAKNQEAAIEKARKADSAKCDDAVQKSLNPEAKLKSAAAGQGC
jgi:hypothetical protein